jgi:hypothetical protein
MLSKIHGIASHCLRLPGLGRLATVLSACVLLLGCRHMSQHGTATSEDAGVWRSDFKAFTETLHAVADDGKVPSFERLLQRAKVNRKSVSFVTDGMGGIIEIPPRDGTIGQAVNRHFAGQRVSWTITVAWEPVWGIGGIVAVGPKQPEAQKLKATRPRQAEVESLQVPKESVPEGLTVREGDELVVEGTIGDANHSTNLELSGVNAAYHYFVNGKGRTVFVVALEDAKVRLK